MNQHLDALNPLLAEDRAQRFPAFASVSSSLLDDLRDVGPFAAESAKALADFEGVRGTLDERLGRMAQEVRSTKAAVHDHAPFNIARGLFPVVLDGVVAACLDTGPIKVGPYAPDVKAIAKAAGLSASELGTLDSLNDTLTAKQLGRVFHLYRSLADGFSQRLAAETKGAGSGEASSGTSHSANLAIGLSRHYHKVLSVILGYTSDRLGHVDVPEDVAIPLQKIQDTASQGRELAELLFSIGPEDTEAERHVSLHAALNDILPLLDAHRSASIELIPECQAADDVVVGRPSELNQLVFSLVTVAMDIAPLGSAITLRTENRSSTGTGSHVHLLVYDAKAQPFDEAAAHLTMGLSAFGPVEDHDLERRLAGMVRRVNALGGSVRIKPQPGRMTSIECVLPVVPLTTVEEDPLSNPGGRLIWLVDDDPWTQVVCRDLLESEGHRVETFGSAEDLSAAWQKASEHPALVVADYNLQHGMNGGELRAWIAEQGSLPFILISSLPSTHPGIEQALELTHTHYLAKPVGHRELADTVGLALGLTLVS